MKNHDLIEKDILKGLNEVHKSNINNRSEWTYKFKEKLTLIGEKYGYIVYPNKDKKEGEWLVDLCWSKEGKDWKIDFKGLKLACEIEWDSNIDEIIIDFQKLTVIDAEIRLFIFQFNKKEEYDNIINAIKLACEFTKHKDYKYLVVGSGNQDDKIRIEKII